MNDAVFSAHLLTDMSRVMSAKLNTAGKLIVGSTIFVFVSLSIIVLFLIL